MGNRVILGQRGSDYGLFISKSGEDVTSTSNPLAFDSRAAESLQVHSYGQGILVPDMTNGSGTALTYTYEGTTYSNHEAVITHSLGYIPAYCIRYCTRDEMAINVPQAYPTSSTTSGSPLSFTGKDFGVAQKVIVNFGAFFDGSTTLSTTTPTSTSDTLTKQTGKYVHITKGTVASNVSLTVAIEDDLDTASDSGAYKITATLSSGTSGAYEVYCEIRDSAGGTYFHKVAGTVYSTDRTGVEVATKVWTPFYVDDFESQYDEDDDNEIETSSMNGMSVTNSTTSAITLENHIMREHDGDTDTASSLAVNQVYFYSYVIFTSANFLNGESF